MDDNHDIENVLKSLPYFEKWSKRTIADCCRLSKIRVFAAGDIIFGTLMRNGIVLVNKMTIEAPNSLLGYRENEVTESYFIIDGKCKLIEQFYFIPKKRSDGKLNYSAFHDENFEKHVNGNNEPKYESLLFNIANDLEMEEMRIPPPSEARTLENLDRSLPENSEIEESKEENEEKEKHSAQNDRRFYKFYSRMLPYLSEKNKKVLQRPASVESHFLQIAFISKGCCLGLGENLRNCFLIAITKVKCLVIPLQFLLQHNPNNMWNRIKQFLSYHLPTKERILHEFLVNRKWNDFKSELVLSKSKKSWANLRDVPVSIRLNDSEFWTNFPGIVIKK